MHRAAHRRRRAGSFSPTQCPDEHCAHRMSPIVLHVACSPIPCARHPDIISSRETRTDTRRFSGAAITVLLVWKYMNGDPCRPWRAADGAGGLRPAGRHAARVAGLRGRVSACACVLSRIVALPARTRRRGGIHARAMLTVVGGAIELPTRQPIDLFARCSTAAAAAPPSSGPVPTPPPDTAPQRDAPHSHPLHRPAGRRAGAWRGDGDAWRLAWRACLGLRLAAWGMFFVAVASPVIL